MINRPTNWPMIVIGLVVFAVLVVANVYAGPSFPCVYPYC